MLFLIIPVITNSACGLVTALLSCFSITALLGRKITSNCYFFHYSSLHVCGRERKNTINHNPWRLFNYIAVWYQRQLQQSHKASHHLYNPGGHICSLGWFASSHETPRSCWRPSRSGLFPWSLLLQSFPVWESPTQLQRVPKKTKLNVTFLRHFYGILAFLLLNLMCTSIMRSLSMMLSERWKTRVAGKSHGLMAWVVL